jgi:chlorite dismutase
MDRRFYGFAGGETGPWRIESMRTLAGPPLEGVNRIDVVPGEAPTAAGTRWLLRGVTSNERYVTRNEKGQLVAKQQGLGRPESTCAALIPIRKSDAWWALTQDERRRIFEDQSSHTRTGLKYLPAVARRLHHCRDLGTAEPFDFLTWFEFAPADAPAFDVLLAELRATAEWRHVEREIEIRLVREAR